MSAPRAGAGCAGHPWLTDETRQLAEQLLDHVEPWVQRLRDGDPEGLGTAATPATCGWCPLCAIVATVRGERPELAVRFAEHAAGLLATARQVLAEQHATAAPGSSEQTVERVQRIDVQRPNGSGSGGC